MRRIRRIALSAEAAGWLAKKSAAVHAVEDHDQRRDEADRLWRSAKGNQRRIRLNEIEETLRTMASGRERCMYCEDSQGSAIEHFWPRHHYPDSTFRWENLLYACTHCNSNEKRTRFPLQEDGSPLLLDPTAEEPLDHLLLVPHTGTIEPRIDAQTGAASLKGKETIDVIGLNRRQNLVKGRRDAWHALQGMITQYDRDLEAGRIEMAAECRDSICKYPFSSVFVQLLSFLELPEEHAVRVGIRPECLAALRCRPEILTWDPGAQD